VVIDGIRFDSQAEGRRYRELKLLQRAGKISDLVCHPTFRLTVKGVLVCKYEGDFQYRLRDDRTGELGPEVIEDCKGVRTPLYKLKKKLLWAVHGIEITEVQA
jgi:hypothetical protein